MDTDISLKSILFASYKERALASATLTYSDGSSRVFENESTLATLNKFDRYTFDPSNKITQVEAEFDSLLKYAINNVFMTTQSG